jgi:hypothetical protein
MQRHSKGYSKCNATKRLYVLHADFLVRQRREELNAKAQEKDMTALAVAYSELKGKELNLNKHMVFRLFEAIKRLKSKANEEVMTNAPSSSTSSPLSESLKPRRAVYHAVLAVCFCPEQAQDYYDEMTAGVEEWYALPKGQRGLKPGQYDRTARTIQVGVITSSRSCQSFLAQTFTL